MLVSYIQNHLSNLSYNVDFGSGLDTKGWFICMGISFVAAAI